MGREEMAVWWCSTEASEKCPWQGPSRNGWHPLRRLSYVERSSRKQLLPRYCPRSVKTIFTGVICSLRASNSKQITGLGGRSQPLQPWSDLAAGMASMKSSDSHVLVYHHHGNHCQRSTGSSNFQLVFFYVRKSEDPNRLYIDDKTCGVSPPASDAQCAT